MASAIIVATIAGQLVVAEARRGQDAPADVVTQAQAVGDWDGDGIPDAQDACAARPETFNGFRDQDGCPDTVTRTRAS